MAISLNNHEQRIKDIDTSLVSLSNRITNLENAPPAKDWAIETLGRSGYSFPYNSKYKGWKWVVIGGELATKGRNRVCTFRNDGVRCQSTLRSDIDEYYTYYNNGSAIIQSGNDRYSASTGNLTVLFYK